jgi:hypothetical protein
MGRLSVAPSGKQNLRIKVGDRELTGEVYLHEYPFPQANSVAFWVGGVTLNEEVELKKDDAVTVWLADGRAAEGKVMEQRDARSVVIAASKPLLPGP